MWCGTHAVVPLAADPGLQGVANDDRVVRMSSNRRWIASEAAGDGTAAGRCAISVPERHPGRLIALPSRVQRG